jgi:hypothetical protein
MAARLKARCFFKVLSRFRSAVHLDENNAQVQLRLKQIRLEVQSFLVGGDGVVLAPQRRVGVAEVEPGGGKIGLKLDHLFQRGGGRVEPFLIESVLRRLQELVDIGRVVRLDGRSGILRVQPGATRQQSH